MILTENASFLQRRFPRLWQNLQSFEPKRGLNLTLETARNQLPTLTVERNGAFLSLHSKYDPQAEGEKLIVGEELDGSQHVFFYGLGLGYHVEAFSRRFPQASFTIFEPFPEILLQCLANRKLADLSEMLQDLQAGFSEAERTAFLNRFISTFHAEVRVIALPSYQRIFIEDYQEFTKTFEKQLAMKRSSLQANRVYQGKWTMNAVTNLSRLLETPALLATDPACFKDKPAIIAAAGPSLQDDLDDLKQIKNEGRAYIFAAGSGLHPLLKQGIIPDGACSYDPNDNTCVFQPVIDGGMDSLPLLFGSTVGFSQFDRYLGPKLHFILNQDQVTPYYLKKRDGSPLEIISDSMTVSAVVLQLLYRLGCNPIIFTGQNLAYRNDQRYAAGIAYYNPKVSAAQNQAALLTEDVYGGQVATSPTFLAMKDNLEEWIKLCGNREIINATQGGARITGASFYPLAEVIRTRLTRPGVVVPDWAFRSDWPYDHSRLAAQQRRMEAERLEFEKIFRGIKRVLTDLSDQASRRDEAACRQGLLKFNRIWKRLIKNDFYRTFLLSFRKVELEYLARQTQTLVREDSVFSQAQWMAESFGRFVENCQSDLQKVLPKYEKLAENLLTRACSGRGAK